MMDSIFPMLLVIVCYITHTDTHTSTHAYIHTRTKFNTACPVNSDTGGRTDATTQLSCQCKAGFSGNASIGATPCAGIIVVISVVVAVVIIVGCCFCLCNFCCCYCY